MKIREKILVIEDEQTIRNFMQAVLTANDYDVLLARTGAMGESMIASHCPDVIILTKPSGTGELLARIRAAIRHTRTPIGSEAVANTGIFKAGDLTIDYAKHRVFIAGQDANLTQNEYKLVALLGLHAGKVLTYDYLIKELWGPSARSDNQILRVNMANIRRKIEQNPAQPVYIFTEVGIGYRMIEGD